MFVVVAWRGVERWWLVSIFHSCNIFMFSIFDFESFQSLLFLFLFCFL